MKTFAEEAEFIRETLSSKERFADVLSMIGIDVNKNFKFTLREERTPSVQIYNTGTCFDFGEGSHKMDIINVIQIHEGLSESDALKRAKELLGIENDKVSYEFKAPVFKNSNGSSESEYDDKPMRESYADYFKQELRKSLSLAEKHLQKLLPKANKEDMEKMISKFEIGYDPKNNMLTMPVRSVKDGHIMNMLKYTSTPGTYEDGKIRPKVKYIYGRRRTIFNLQVLKTAPKIVYVFEGEKDVINATLKGKAAITQGASTGWKKWMPKAIEMVCKHYKVKVPTFVIIQDHDRPGVLATLKIYKDLKDIAETKMAFWDKSISQKLLKLKSFQEHKDNVLTINSNVKLKKGFDYTDYVTA